MRRSVSPFVMFVVGAAATLALAIYSAFAPVADETLAYTTALGTAAICSMCAAVVLGVARSFGRREPWRRQWILVGLGIASFALGQLLRATHIALGPVVSWLPSPDAFLLAQYVLLCAAFVAVAQSYRLITDSRRPTFIVTAFGAAALAALWFGLIRPFVLVQATGVVDGLRAALYPAADILFLLVPAAFVSLMLAQLGGMRFARPWYLVAVGGGILALSDAAMVWSTMMGTYLPGTLVDFGPIMAELLMASGALAVARLAEEFMVPSHRRSTGDVVADAATEGVA